jgi:hypothetical protein
VIEGPSKVIVLSDEDEDEDDGYTRIVFIDDDEDEVAEPVVVVDEPVVVVSHEPVVVVDEPVVVVDEPVVVVDEPVVVVDEPVVVVDEIELHDVEDDVVVVVEPVVVFRFLVYVHDGEYVYVVKLLEESINKLRRMEGWYSGPLFERCINEGYLKWVETDGEEDVVNEPWVVLVNEPMNVVNDELVVVFRFLVDVVDEPVVVVDEPVVVVDEEEEEDEDVVEMDEEEEDEEEGMLASELVTQPHVIPTIPRVITDQERKLGKRFFIYSKCYILGLHGFPKLFNLGFDLLKKSAELGNKAAIRYMEYE